MSNAQEIIAELDRGKLPDQLKFFEGDGRKKDLVCKRCEKILVTYLKLVLSF